MMILGGLAELIFGVRAEGQSLESIALPLTVADEPTRGGRPAGVSAAPASS
jgi:hypothetical protein